MSIITRMLRQRAVYWGNPRPDDDGMGGYQYDGAVEIKCRWEDKQELFIDPEGREQLSRSIIYADRDLVVGGQLWLGLLTDVPGQNPELIAAAMKILQFAKLPNLRNTENLRTTWL